MTGFGSVSAATKRGYSTDRFSMRLRSRHITLLLVGLFAVTGCVGTANRWATESTPGSYHYQMGMSYLGERNYTGALVELTEAAKLDPDNPDVLYNLAIAYMGKRRPDLAEPRFLKALSLKPNFSSARNDLGVAYLELKRWDNAIQQFKIVKDDLFFGQTENAAINLGLAYLGKGDYPRALNELNAVLRGNPRRLEARLSLGRVYFSMDNVEQAIIEYRRVIDIYRDYSDAHYHLGLAYLKQQNIGAARDAFHEVIRIKPDSELGRSAMGYLDLLK